MTTTTVQATLLLAGPGPVAAPAIPDRSAA